ncbi:MAG: hypothetical protein H6728_13760 [Myxococcales bacterium]|nr:hypothetical protein [Myxococcales bacterium]MCB9644137.1 hypothetical protein [Myxococcales bacterium]
MNLLRFCLILALSSWVVVQAQADVAPPPTHKNKTASSPKDNPVAVAHVFWESVKAHDFAKMEEVVGTPFTWDSRCRFFETFAQVRHKIATGPPTPPGLTFAQYALIDPSKISKKSRFLRGIRRLYQPRLCSDARSAAHQKALMRYREAFVTLYIVVKKELVPTVTRLSWIGKRWKVTGFDN